MNLDKIWPELVTRVDDSKSPEDNEAIVGWLISLGINELEARDMVQFQTAVADGREPPL